MKRQRVLALLLALSLALSTNGVTALAAGSDLSGVSVTTENQGGLVSEGTADEATDDSQQTTDDETEEPDKTADDGQSSPEQPGDVAGNDQSGPEQSGDPTGDDQSGSEQPGDSAGDDQSGSERPGDDRNDSEQPDDSTGNDQNDPEKPDGTEEENPGDVEGPGSDDEITDETEEDDELTDEEDMEKESEEEQEDLTKVQSIAPRMMTFQDEVGMRITYNANETYLYTVSEDGTLTAITKADGSAVEGNVVLDETKGIKSIASGAFTGNTKITYIKMPAGVVSIGADAFQGCTSLKGMTIPTGATTIGESAFEGCSALTQFALPATVESIGNRAFYGDSRLFMVYMKSISISRLQSIGDYAFYGCAALEEFCSDMKFTFPESLTSIGAYAFSGCRAVKSIVFSENISVMGEHVFESCSALTEITLPRMLGAVPQYGFADCHALVSVQFDDENVTAKIGAYAFKGCYNLGSIELRQVSVIEQNAFIDCARLIRVLIWNLTCEIQNDAFPDVETLYLLGIKGSTAEKYTKNRKIKFIDLTVSEDKEFYKYKEPIETSGTGKGKIFLTTTRSAAEADLKANDPNKANGGQGVVAGTKIYVVAFPEAGNKLVSGSLKCNGEIINSEKYDGASWYTFNMPKGGALITAEFEITGGNTTIVGTDYTYEFSNGSDGDGGAELKIGQSTRLFLLDVDKNVIPYSKVTLTSDKPAIVEVNKNGTITALKEGLAHIEMRATGGNGEIVKRAPVHVSKTDVASLKLSASAYDRDIIQITEQTVGGQAVQTAYMDIIAVSTKDAEITLKAVAYDDDLDDMEVALKWTTSDSKVAKLASSSTANAAATNKVTIPKNASGEATITVSATNADKKTISQKFIIQVRDQTPRLSTTSLTLNLYKEEGAVLRIINAYGAKIDTSTFKLVEAERENIDATDFKWEYNQADSTDTVHYFTINPRYSALEEKTYTVKVSVNSKVNPTPLKIMVKSSLPNPKVAFDKKQQKINLFYANDGTEIRPVITNLGNERVSRYELEPLSTDPKKDDWLFTENFEIDEETGVITQKNEKMVLTDKKKLIATGNLVLHFEGYKDNAVRKYKITIPTQTVKPSYKLDRTSDTYNTTPAERTIKLTLMDTKTKKPVDWAEADGEWTVTKSPKSTNANAVSNEIVLDEEGQIVMQVNGSTALRKGQIVLVLRNDSWADGQSFEYKYNINASAANPKIKLRKATVNLNSNYTEQEEKFYLDSNQCDTKLSDTQEFVPAPTKKNGEQFEHITLSYENGVGTVSVDSDIKPGAYKFKCDYVLGMEGERYNAVTLTVKVVNTVPTMTVKGAPAINLSAKADGEYTETAELALNAKLPEGYELDGAAMTGTIKCTTKGMSGIEENFNWDIADNKLLISLNSLVNQQQYAFTMTPVYTNGGNMVEGKDVRFSVKVYNGEISVKMTAKGVLNLVDRESREYTLKNSIVYTPSFKNLKDTIEEVQIFDAGDNDKYPELGDDESRYFYAEVLDGKVYVAPREDAELENKTTYPIMMWIRLADYGGYDGMWVDGRLNVKTAQVLPKVTANKQELNLYLSNKGYEATFRVTPKEGSVGRIVGAEFGEKDEKSQDSFEISCVPRPDGSADIKVKLNNAVSFAGGSTNKVTMYVIFDGQGTNTTGPAVTMNIKINK